MNDPAPASPAPAAAAPQPLPRAIGYVRVSTDRQETDRQCDAVRKWAVANGLDLTELITEPCGISGRAEVVKAARAACRSTRSEAARKCIGDALHYYADLALERFGCLERSGYASVLRQVTAAEPTGAPIRFVVFYALDRLSRDTVELLLLELILRRHGVTIVNTAEGGTLDTSTAAGKFLFRVLCAKAELECDQTSERTSSTLQRMRDRGEKIGRPPVGWKKVGDTFEHDPETWPKVAAVHAMRAAGARYKAIAAEHGLVISCVRGYIESYSWQPPII